MPLELMWTDRDQSAGQAGTPINRANLSRMFPSFAADERLLAPISGARRGIALKAGSRLRVGPEALVFGADEDVIFNHAEQLLDSGVSFAPGRDYYIYICLAPEGGARLAVSLNAGVPQGSDAQASRKIGGFHTLCAGVGAISGHPLAGFAAGDILPASVWCLAHRPACGPEGMVYVEPLDFWADIYAQSGTGGAAKSVFGGSSVLARSFNDHLEDLFRAGKRPLGDAEFSCAAEGSNCKTAVSTKASPPETGGHSDTAGRRMISNHGLEDCCGAWWQKLAGACRVATEASYVADPSGKGSNCYGGIVIAGGGAANGANCGPRARHLGAGRLEKNATQTCRGAARGR